VVFLLDFNVLWHNIERIGNAAQKMGLDFYDMEFILCTPEEMSFIGAYGMPRRFCHWTLGKEFYRLYLRQRLGLIKIHELVMNSNPCTAFLLKGNSLLENKISMAHAIAHSDFFKNNIFYSHDSKTVARFFAENQKLFSEFEERYGKQKVEKILEAALALRCIYFSQGLSKDEKSSQDAGEEDIYLYICRNSKVLEDWQKEIIYRLRHELEYFRTHACTKLINEGWAAFWHTKILRELDLSADEAVEFALMNAKALSHQDGECNLYLLGREIFADLEKSMGTKKIFEIRSRENDLGFIEKYLSHNLIKRLGLFFYSKKKGGFKEIIHEPAAVKMHLVKRIKNCWYPHIVIVQGKGDKSGLYLHHHYDGYQLNSFYVKKTLERIFMLWGETVSIETFWKRRPVVFAYNGKEHILADP